MSLGNGQTKEALAAVAQILASRVFLHAYQQGVTFVLHVNSSGDWGWGGGRVHRKDSEHNLIFSLLPCHAFRKIEYCE